MAVLEQDRHARAVVVYTKHIDAGYATRIPDAAKEVEKRNAQQSRFLEDQQFEFAGKMIESAKKQI